ncbi:oxamate carbamoyltransferase subunit AllH family protein [Thermosipho atlanticus]|uniref:DUF2877 domain-containing protein n=1 Tax=Thermosipho atlanticus DSM 15807 TaxID=1123380 RepID=A0A1M5SIR2_9BACT|nr:DUF2877 domain-containing protein [Thermosipho atlanticus]SHH38477.1 Protein of unknown function [Thermosipho atlanticus DSM 15807]
MIEVSSLILKKNKNKAKSFFRTKHTKYYTFEDDDILTLTIYNNRVGALGMVAQPYFLKFNEIIIEGNKLIFDYKNVIDDFKIYNPKLQRVNFYENFEKIAKILEEKIDNRIFSKIMNDLNQTEYIKLIGFGPGLTPLFDDILSGILLLKSFYSQNFDKESILKIAKERTNDISFYQLYYASNGYAPKPVKMYLENGIKEFLLNMGDTSGLGWMLGISFFFELEG